jgi:AcrR family transcriptional regulator
MPTLRRDARRNRDSIVSAARQVFASVGFDAPLDAVARRAGVGRGTLYRHFPDRHALAVAIFEENVREIERAAESAVDGPGGFDVLLRSVVEQQVRSPGLVPAVLSGTETSELRAMGVRVACAFAAPLRRAQEAGSVRSDLTTADVVVIVRMVTAVVDAERDEGRRRLAAARALDLLGRGLG